MVSKSIYPLVMIHHKGRLNKEGCHKEAFYVANSNPGNWIPSKVNSRNSIYPNSSKVKIINKVALCHFCGEPVFAARDYMQGR